MDKSIEIHKKLSSPFENSDIEWRLQWADDEKPRGLAVPYITNRAIQSRLDTVVGIENWKNEYIPWHSDGKKASQLCGISIRFSPEGEWITKYDGADDSDIEPIKGGLSDSMKRSAVQWGIGRYLYGMDTVFVETEKRGRTTVIRKSEQPKLDSAHGDYVARIFPSNVSAPKPQNNGAPTQAAVQDTAPQNQPKPQVRPQQASPNVQTQKKSQAQPVQNAPENNVPRNCFTILKAVTVASVKRKEDTKLQLEDSAGKRFEVYVYYTNPQLTPGTILSNCKITPIKNGDVVFFLLEEYTIYVQHNAA